MKLEGIHHITAITADAQDNIDFYAGVLGLRLVKKTVNQDDPTVYHLFFADEQGRAGSDITFFEFPGAPRGRAGAGMVHTIVWRVGSPDALDFWEERLAANGIGTERDDDVLRFADPEGLGHELRPSDVGDEPLSAEHPEIPPENALQGFDAVRAYASVPEASEGLLGELGFSGDGGGSWEARGAHRGGWIHYEAPPDERGMQGAGTVHHVAWGTTAYDHPHWLKILELTGVPNSGVIDRHYFHSIYFREPSGVLFEIADDAPGFTVDVPLEQLGSVVILPPRLEPHRTEIERRLTPLPDPRAGWAPTP